MDIKSSRKDNESLRAELELQVGTNRDLENEKKDLMESMLSQVPPEGVSMNTKVHNIHLMISSKCASICIRTIPSAEDVK